MTHRNKDTGLSVAHMLKQGMPAELDAQTIAETQAGRMPGSALCYGSVTYEGPDGELNREYYILAGDECGLHDWVLDVWMYDRRRNHGFLHASKLHSFEQEDAEWDFYEPGTTLAHAMRQVEETWSVHTPDV